MKSALAGQAVRRVDKVTDSRSEPTQETMGSHLAASDATPIVSYQRDTVSTSRFAVRARPDDTYRRVVKWKG